MSNRTGTMKITLHLPPEVVLKLIKASGDEHTLEKMVEHVVEDRKVKPYVGTYAACTRAILMFASRLPPVL